MNNWLNERSKLLAKYAEQEIKKANHIQLSLDKPDCGWINAHFMVNNIEKTYVEFSDVYEPFTDIKKWLEDIAYNQYRFKYAPSMVNIDCEGYNAFLYYEPIVWGTGLINHKHYKYYGLFYIYETHNDQITLDAFCDTWEFVKTFYSSIIEYAKDMQNYDKFIDEWVWDAYNSEMSDYDEDSPELKELFLNKMKSEEVENYIKKFRR